MSKKRNLYNNHKQRLVKIPIYQNKQIAIFITFVKDRINDDNIIKIINLKKIEKNTLLMS